MRLGIFGAQGQILTSRLFIRFLCVSEYVLGDRSGALDGPCRRRRPIDAVVQTIRARQVGRLDDAAPARFLRFIR
jgi:hypothetical protein